MRVSVFGLGYVGCVTAACFAKTGHEVIGIDVDEQKISMINAGQSPVVEPGLGDLLAEVVGTGRLRATSCVEEAVRDSELSLICVGTPGYANGQPDFRALRRVGQEIGLALGRHRKPYTVVVRSTVLPGTTEHVLGPAVRGQVRPDAAASIKLAVNPEFTRESSSLRDFWEPPFTLVGCDDPATASLLRTLYQGVQAPVVHTTIRTAEMVKYVSNAFHALKVCFANEIGDVCQALGANPREVMRIFRMDRKLNISDAYLHPGFAFGGSCLPKDVRALVHGAGGADVSVPLLAAILPSNEGQIRRGIDEVLRTRRRRVGVVGLSFKPGTDDLRESPMVLLVEALIGKGCDVRILDRNVSVARLIGANRRYIEEEIPHIASLLCERPDALLAHAEVVVVGSASEEAAAVLAGLRPDHVVVDLTRGTGGPCRTDGTKR